MPTHEWIDRELQKAADKMESEGLLMAPVQRFSLVLEAEIARLLLDITDAKPELFPIGWHNLESFGYSVVCILTGRWNCGDNRYLAEASRKRSNPSRKLCQKIGKASAPTAILTKRKCSHSCRLRPSGRNGDARQTMTKPSTAGSTCC